MAKASALVALLRPMPIPKMSLPAVLKPTNVPGSGTVPAGGKRPPP